MAVTEPRHDGKNDVRHPRRQHGREVGLDGESGAHRLQHDIQKAQCQSYAEVEAHAPLPLLGAQGDTDDGKYERGEAGCYALVVFNLILHDIA